jgi:ribonuclease E
LVELTRKRQGQNIYELFGRACPSCGGLGHVAVLPGKDTLQPLATLTGLVRSVASARAEVLTPGGGADGSSRRRRGGRGGRGGGEVGDEIGVSSDLSTPTDETGRSSEGLAAATEAPSRRQEPELVAVPMQADQELVFGWMGLNPALLLDQPGQPVDNLMVRVIRPGEDAEAVLEEARQQLAASGGRRRRRGRGGAGAEGSLTTNAALVPSGAAPVEITPLPEPSEFALVQEPLSMVVGMAREETRPQSAPSALPSAPVAEAAIAEAAADKEDDSCEPRRRRRRSSAAV